MCGRAGRLECDHVMPMQREPGQDPYDPNGLQALCRSCHVAKTATENRRPQTPDEMAWRALVAELIDCGLPPISGPALKGTSKNW